MIHTSKFTNPPPNFKKTILTPEEEMAFKKWYGNAIDEDDYDWRGFYLTEKKYDALKPSLESYYKDNPDYHAYSIGFDGRILKSPKHPTYHKTLEAEKHLGNIIEMKDGRYYSIPSKNYSVENMLQNLLNK